MNRTLDMGGYIFTEFLEHQTANVFFIIEISLGEAFEKLYLAALWVDTLHKR